MNTNNFCLNYSCTWLKFEYLNIELGTLIDTHTYVFETTPQQLL